MTTDTDDALEVSQETDVEVQKIPTHFITSNGETVYVAEDKEALELIGADARTNNLEFYYVLGLDSPSGNDPAVMTLFKVNDNLVSQSFVPVSGAQSLPLTPIKNTALYKLCRIPWELIEKVETFFRKVDEDLGGSEAIIILGFDDRHEITDSDGWRVIVPRQNNSSTHCNYDPMSIPDFIDDDDYEFIRQVGTIHSHPGMSAYASHTDEKDQETFDGLHITIGWKGNLTEFHAEIQAGGQNFKAEPGLVIDIPEKVKKDYPEFDDWSSRVKKQNPQGPKGMGWSATKTTTTTTPNSSSNSGYGPSFNSNWQSGIQGIRVPDGCPSITEYTVVTNLLTAHDKHCPVCHQEMTSESLELRRCRNCMCFVAYNGEEIHDIIRVRNVKSKPTYELDLEQAKRKIAYWRRNGVAGSEVEFIPINGGSTSPKVLGTPPPPPPPEPSAYI